MDPPAALDAGDADATALAHACAVVDALPCPEYMPHNHSSGAPSKLKVSSKGADSMCWCMGCLRVPLYFHAMQTTFLKLALGSGEQTCSLRLPVRRSCLKPAGRSMPQQRHGRQRGLCSPAFWRLGASSLPFCTGMGAACIPCMGAACSPLQRLEPV